MMIKIILRENKKPLLNLYFFDFSHLLRHLRRYQPGGDYSILENLRKDSIVDIIELIELLELFFNKRYGYKKFDVKFELVEKNEINKYYARTGMAEKNQKMMNKNKKEKTINEK